MPQGGTSPQQQYIFPNPENLPGRTPSPNYNFSPQNFVSVTPPLNNMSPSMPNNLPISHMSEGISNYFNTQQNWATPNAVSVGNNVVQFEATNSMQVETTPTGLSSVLDLDSKELRELNSAELAGLNSLNLLDANLSENLTNNLSLNDVGQESMTDSFTRLTTATINNICNLNDIYKPNIKE